jgi:hypothetical protein
VEIRKGLIKIFDGGIEYYLSKREDLFNTSGSDQTEKNIDTVILKKEKKRFEAEIRQKKYAATKELVGKIKFLKNITA